MVRGERPIKLGNSWFSVKAIEVARDMVKIEVELLDRCWVVIKLY